MHLNFHVQEFQSMDISGMSSESSRWHIDVIVVHYVHFTFIYFIMVFSLIPLIPSFLDLVTNDQLF